MSPACSPYNIAKYYLETLLDSDFESEFYNSKLGIPFVPKESSITEDMVLSCLGKSRKTSIGSGKVITMGVDVGKVLHVVIAEWDTPDTDPEEIMKSSFKKIIYEGTVADFASLDVMMKNYNINYCVVDALPETRSAIEFANRFFGRVKICFYNTGDKAVDLIIHTDHEHKITVGRTIWLDISVGRITRKDPHGNPRAFWESVGADHFAHSNLYCECALKVLALTCGQNESLNGVY